MEIEIPNRTSNGYYHVKKYIVIKYIVIEFGSKTLQFGKISGQEKKIQIQLQEAEWERMKENYFSPDNVATNKGQVVLSDKFQLQLEEWISPEQNKYHLIKFVQRDKGAGDKNIPYPYSLTVSEYHNLMKLFPVIDISLSLCGLERIKKDHLHSPSSQGNFVQVPRKEVPRKEEGEEEFDWQQFRRDLLARSDKRNQ